MTYQTNDRNALIVPVLRVFLPRLASEVPVCTMDEGAFELVEAVDVRPFPSAKDARTHEQEVGVVLKLFKLTGFGAGRSFDRDVPLSALLVVTSMSELMAKVQIGLELILCYDALHVFVNLSARGIER